MAAPRFSAVVVAAGQSRRMDGIDKLEALIAGRPLLAWAIEALAAVEEIEQIVLVVAPERVNHQRRTAWLPARVSAVVPGGVRRQESVAAGVAWLREHGTNEPERDILLVHDGARPAASPGLVRRVAQAAAAEGAAVPVLPIVETVKEVAGGRIVRTVDRSRLGTAQTPQAVRLALLEAAWMQFPPSGPETWTDEAALLEACTIPVHVVAGEPENLKVTVPADLTRAEALVGARSAPRLGYGSDVHAFGPGRPLALGGVTFDEAPRLAGHSDGDVALHAVADALLGAAGLDDLGRLFPADARTPAGIPSTDLLARVVDRLAAAGLGPRSVDPTIVGARPHLSSRLDEMRRRIASSLHLDPADVSVKASTGNLVGPEGAGRSLAAHAIATVEPRR